GADVVVVQIRVGGQAARLGDETIPLACGCVGQETTGAGGFAKAMRTVPVVLSIAERARELAAEDAWIVDFTNPVGIVTRALLEQRGGAFYSEAATALIGSLVAGTGDVQVVDVRNGDALAGLQPDDVVELPARIERRGPVPLPQPPLAPELLGLVQHVGAYERLAAEAAITGDRELVYKALLAHPLIGQVPKVEQLTEELLAAGREHLPQFQSREPVR